jgi:hypothetical protein
MSNFVELEKRVMAVFGATEWSSNGILTVPWNFINKVSGEYIRYSVIASGDNSISNAKSGHLQVEIFFKRNTGPVRAAEIGDLLSDFLERKSFSTSDGRNLQFFTATMSPLGPDPDNPDLNRALFSISFNFFGVN